MHIGITGSELFGDICYVWTVCKHILAYLYETTYTTWSCRVYPSYVKGCIDNLSAKLSESQTDRIADSDARILERKGKMLRQERKL